jgi:hypothetical protein
MSTVSGTVTAKHNKLYDDVPPYWTEVHTEACIAVTKKYYRTFLDEEERLKTEQDLAHARILKNKELKAEEKVMRNSLNQVSYYSIPTLRTITNHRQLDAALTTLSTMTKKLDFLKLFIQMYGIGFGLDSIPIKFSNAKDKKVGSFDDLIARAKHILEQNFVIPESPKIRKVTQITPSEFGLTPVEEWTECCGTYVAKAGDRMAEVLELDRQYGIKLLYDWDSIQRQYWDVPLTSPQKEFRRDRVFREDGEVYRVIGLSWDTKRNEYAAYYHEHNLRKPPTRVNDPLKRVEHSFFVSIYDNTTSTNTTNTNSKPRLNNNIIN